MEKMESTQSLKDAIALMSKSKNEQFKPENETIPVFGDFDDMTLLGDEAPELAAAYIDQKLENSGVLVRFFDRIFNENDDDQIEKNNG
jgi:hypothetical protein